MKTLLKESLISIKKNFKRFLSILLIVLLGVGFFAGIKVSSPDMEKTINVYYNDTNFMDFNLLSTWGIKKTDVDILKDKKYKVEAAYEFDTIVEGEIEEVVKILSYNEAATINNIVLLDGKIPTNYNECLIEKSDNTKKYKLGDVITVKDDALKETNLKIVGFIKSPIYTSLERGTTTLLSGKISYFMYVPIENFNMDYYTNLYLKLNLKDRNVFSEKYKNLIETEAEKLKEISKGLADERYSTERENALKELQTQENKYKTEKEKFDSEIKKANEKLEDSKKIYNNGIQKLNSEISKTEKEFENARKQLQKSKAELSENKKNLLSKEAELNKSKKQLADLNNTYKNLNDKYNSLETEINNLLLSKKELEELIVKEIDVEKNSKQLENIKTSIETLEKEKAVINVQLETVYANITKYQVEITSAEQIILKTKNQLNQAEKQISEKEKEINNNYKLYKDKISGTKNELNNAYQKIKKGEEELISKQKDAKAEFERAEKAINEAKEKIDKLEEPIWYVLDNNSNIGFYQYSQDTDRIAKIGQVFPFVFFVVAILICLTSMTRMVEEERNQLGTLKALGYSNIQIITKYIIYVLFATIIGAIVGSIIGMRIIPYIIINMYILLYSVGEPVLVFDINYALIGTILALGCILFATLLAAYKELYTQPATLMRPKSPKSGKRVLLERITFIWKRLSFTKKVTVRNVFRYKKRFLMTIIGIAGCTGLIIAGFGLRDCIMKMVPKQYEEIFNYQIEVTFKDYLSLTQKDKEVERIKSFDKINSIAKVQKESVDIKNKETNQTIQLIVPFDKMDGFINLKNRKSEEKFNLNNDGIITEKLSELLNVKVGDKLVVSTDKEYSFKIGKITENYFDHYIYMDKSIYNSDNYNTLLIKTDMLTSEDEKVLAQNLRENNLIATVVYTSSMMSIFDKTMENFGLVAVVLIVSAGLLAFVVLYNLASVNMSERKRELATIKVLGFFDKEVYNYIGRETTILTIIGMIFGVISGKILTIYILKTCELDSVMFNTEIGIKSYIYSLLITVVFTLLVNITTYFSLKKIDMIESLKSVE